MSNNDSEEVIASGAEIIKVSTKETNEKSFLNNMVDSDIERIHKPSLCMEDLTKTPASKEFQNILDEWRNLRDSKEQKQKEVSLQKRAIDEKNFREKRLKEQNKEAELHP